MELGSGVQGLELRLPEWATELRELVLLLGAEAPEEGDLMAMGHPLIMLGRKRRMGTRRCRMPICLGVEDGTRTRDTWNHNPVL